MLEPVMEGTSLATVLSLGRVHRRLRGVSMNKIIGGVILVVAVFITASWAEAATYLNCGTSEPTINGSANTLWCDDFEDGDMVYDNTNDSNAANDGYFHTPFENCCFPDAGGHAFGRCGTAAGVALVVGGTPGAAGTNCAASTGVTNGSGEGQVPSQSDHGFSSTIGQGQDLYFRYYKKCITSPSCTWSTNTKETPTLNRQVGWGGIDFGNAGARPPQNCPISLSAGAAGCWLATHEMDVKSEGSRVLSQNQGTNDGSCASGHSCWEDGRNTNHWYYFEHHIKMNTPGVANGEYDLWIDDCGTTGLTGGCATGGTLRAHYTNVQWLQSNGQTPSGATAIGSAWIEQYSSGTGGFVLVGEWYWDQFVASKVRIGPKGASGTGSDTTPPQAPANLRVQ